VDTPQQRTILGHPVGLYVLFFTEMWERFSYYGMRALLVLYMVDFFKMTQEDASKVYKWYTSLVYLTPILGGFLADRYLGNKLAIIIGAILMAIGHFLMAFEDMWIFYSALGFLIMGNGFFKPNMSVQVGRLYPQNDPRRDGAYTIFYMGINLGAFLSPLVCGALKDASGLGFHWGFGAAGVGMVLGLLVYLFGLPAIKELPAGAQYVPPPGEEEHDDEGHVVDSHAMTEEEANTAPSAVPTFSRLSPAIFMLLGTVVALVSPVLGFQKIVNWDNVISLELAAICAFIAAWILSKLSMAVRDRVLAIYILFPFVVFFWGAFEQAGNAMNVWADQTTNRYLTADPKAPEIYPEAPVDLAETGLGTALADAFSKLAKINPVLTTSFQSINAAAIVFFAPIFAWLWLFLARRHVHLSIATKMSIGVFLQGVAFALMIWAAKYENQPSSTAAPPLPVAIAPDEQGVLYFMDAPNLGSREELEAFEKKDVGKAAEALADEGDEHKEPMIAHGGRLHLKGDKLLMSGVLNVNHRDRILRATVPKSYVEAIWELALRTKEAKESALNDDVAGDEFSVEMTLDELPPGFEPRYLNGFKTEELSYDTETRTFTVTTELADKDYKRILVAGANPAVRDALNNLYVASAAFKVSSWWLFWFYVICTLGELCLSPVGLSMVSKLAPRRFATMLMGIWLLTSFFGNFTAGLAGENWEKLEPIGYFSYVALAMFGASIVCFVLVKVITRMMHGVD